MQTCTKRLRRISVERPLYAWKEELIRYRTNTVGSHIYDELKLTATAVFSCIALKQCHDNVLVWKIYLVHHPWEFCQTVSLRAILIGPNLYRHILYWFRKATPKVVCASACTRPSLNDKAEEFTGALVQVIRGTERIGSGLATDSLQGFEHHDMVGELCKVKTCITWFRRHFGAWAKCIDWFLDFQDVSGPRGHYRSERIAEDKLIAEYMKN